MNQTLRRRKKPARHARRPRPVDHGFTLVELMVVVIVLAILAATIVPQFTGVKYDAQVAKARSDISQLEGHLERFKLKMDRYPTTEEGLRVLVDPPPGVSPKKWGGPYIKKLPGDPWGNPYQYRFPGVHDPRSYDLWSRGQDGQDGGEGEAADITSWDTGERKES